VERRPRVQGERPTARSGRRLGGRPEDACVSSTAQVTSGFQSAGRLVIHSRLHGLVVAGWPQEQRSGRRRRSGRTRTKCSVCQVAGKLTPFPRVS
jgi:hypothetical protein